MILRDLFRGIDNFREYTEILLENEYIADSIIKAYGGQELVLNAFIISIWDKTSRNDEEKAIYQLLIKAR